MKRSLQRHLSLMLGGAIVLAGLAATVGSFGLAYFEAKEFQDNMLRQIATLNVESAAESPFSGSQRQSGRDITASDPESRIVLIHLPRNPRPDWLAPDVLPGFLTLSTGPERLRIFIRDTPSGERIVVAQPTDARDEIAINSALHTLIPLLLLIPLLTWLIARIVRSELRPITRLSQNLDQQTADRPQAIADEGLPDEITPFVHAINRLLERVNQLLEQQRRFIADAAHELRSPLTALSLQVQNLESAEMSGALRERVTPLRAGIDRARRLTEQLLSLAKSQADHSAQGWVDLSKMAREIIAEYLPLAESRSLDLGLEDAENIVLAADPQTLRLVIKNALDNALRYTPLHGKVTLRLYTDGQVAVIEVCDTGPGIPAADRDRVFNPFYRLAGAGGEGSGLGLTIARDAAARLGGTVSLHDGSECRGLVFRYRQRRML